MSPQGEKRRNFLKQAAATLGLAAVGTAVESVGESMLDLDWSMAEANDDTLKPLAQRIWNSPWDNQGNTGVTKLNQFRLDPARPASQTHQVPVNPPHTETVNGRRVSITATAWTFLRVGDSVSITITFLGGAEGAGGDPRPVGSAILPTKRIEREPRSDKGGGLEKEGGSRRKGLDK